MTGFSCSLYFFSKLFEFWPLQISYREKKFELQVQVICIGVSHPPLLVCIYNLDSSSVSLCKRVLLIASRIRPFYNIQRKEYVFLEFVLCLLNNGGHGKP